MDEILWFSAHRFGTWGECETRALDEERSPGARTEGPESIVGSAGHEALEQILPVKFDTRELRRDTLVARFRALVRDQRAAGHDVPERMSEQYAQALWDLSQRDDLWPAPHELLSVEASGIQRRHRIDDIHGKPGFGVVIGALKSGQKVGLRGRMDVAAVRDDDPAACEHTDWGFAKEKPPIAAKVYALTTFIMFPGFARYVARQVYLMAGLRAPEVTFAAEQMPDLRAEILERMEQIVEARESGQTVATPNSRCDECPLAQNCAPYQAALQPMRPPSEPAVLWPTDLTALSTEDLLAVYRRFDAPRKVVEAYWEALKDEMKARLAGEQRSVVAPDEHGVKLSLQGNGFNYPDVKAYIAWCVRYGIPIHEGLKPIGDNKDLMRLINRITDEPTRKAALEELDKLRDERPPKRVLVEITPKGARKLPEATEPKAAAA